jgi:ATP-binding cassette subfamily B protein
VSERIGADLRTATYEHLLKLSQEYFGGKRTGDLMARIGSETDRISIFLSLHLLDFATDVLMIVMTAAILVSIDPWLAAGHAGAAALHRLADPRRARKAAHRLREGRPRLGGSDQRAGRHDSRHPRGQGLCSGEARGGALPGRQRAQPGGQRPGQQDLVLFSPTVTLLTEIGLLIVWAFGIWQIAKDQITVGVLTAFLAYISRFYLRLDSMSRIVSVTQKAAAGAKRIFDILDHVSSVPEPIHPVHLPKVSGRIELRGVGFRYGTRSVTRDIDIVIKPGEMVGLVGHSGSGKSTLVNLICRFYDVTEGAILIDGVDIRSVPVAEYRRHIGLVLQEPFLFFGTIAENIAYGKPDAPPRGDRRRRARRARPRIHPAPAARLRLAGRRTRAGTVRRRTTAHLDRPRAAHRPAHPDPRRGHLVGRHRRPRRKSRRRSTTWYAGARRSPSRTACPPCVTPIAWSFSTAAASSRSAATTS